MTGIGYREIGGGREKGTLSSLSVARGGAAMRPKSVNWFDGCGPVDPISIMLKKRRSCQDIYVVLGDWSVICNVIFTTP
jgi:hypothetical protein